MMKHFNRTCQTFTTVNAFKYQLQHFLFYNQTTLLQNLTSIVTGLQATARYLKEIAITEVITTSIHYHGHNYYVLIMSLQGTVCVKFTPKQYMKLYECGLLYFNYTKLMTNASVIKSLSGTLMTMTHRDGFPNTITTDLTTPTQDSCS